VAQELMRTSVLERTDARDKVENTAKRRRRAARRERRKFLLDVTMLAAGVAFSTAATVVSIDHRPSFAWILVYPLLVLGLLAARGMYVLRLRRDILDEARPILAATALAAMAVITLQVARGADEIGYEVVRPWLFTTAYLLAGRVALYLIDSRALRRRELGQRTLIVGAGHVGRLVARRLRQSERYGLIPVGFVDKEPLESTDDDDPPVLGASWDLERLIDEESIEHVVITFSTAPHSVLTRLTNRCHDLGVGVSVVPRLFESLNDRVCLDRLGNVPLLTVRRPHPAGVQFALKYLIDRVVAAVLLVLVSPVFGASALAVRLSIGRPIFFKQRRVGRDDVVFEMLKFRTMRGSRDDLPEMVSQLMPDVAPGGVDAEERTGVTTFMRKHSLDELPQLINVIKGEMSIVGPRPERPEYVAMFRDQVPRYGERHRVKAGITGWAQVNGLRGRTSLSDRVEWDNYYIENWSLWLDIKILLLTCIAIFSPRSAE
jgi:exopolysaccharide biosynthesis polyprenyl glycosylphosphotransferase